MPQLKVLYSRSSLGQSALQVCEQIKGRAAVAAPVVSQARTLELGIRQKSSWSKTSSPKSFLEDSSSRQQLYRVDIKPSQLWSPSVKKSEGKRESYPEIWLRIKMQLQLLLLSIATLTTIAQRLVEAGSLVRTNLFKRFLFFHLSKKWLTKHFARVWEQICNEAKNAKKIPQKYEEKTHYITFHLRQNAKPKEERECATERWPKSWKVQRRACR